MEKIYILTKNPGKIMVAKSVFNKYNYNVEFINNNYPEIQADTSLEIAKYTALFASSELKNPVIREDHSLFINSLNIPGPYISYIEKKLPAAKLLKILKDQKDRSGYFEIATVYAEPDGFYKEYIFTAPINLAKEERGNLQKGWNRVIMINNEKRTLAEYPEDERVSVWSKNYEEIAKFLLNRN